MAAIGLVIGLGAAMLVTRSLTPLLHDVSAFDLVSLAVAVAAAVLAIATLLATIIPARRAVRLEPMAALRGE